MKVPIAKMEDKLGIKTFLKQNWFGFLGISIGVLGATFSFYSYRLAKATREPVFLIDPVRTEIINSKRLVQTPLRIVRSDSSRIEGDITSIRFYFWNNGRKSIKSVDILEPIIVSLDDENGEILDHKILKTSREVIDANLDRNPDNPKQSLVLSFKILEENDGITCQLIFKGNARASLLVSGTIEGVKSVITTLSFRGQLFWKVFFRRIKPWLFLIIVGALIYFTRAKGRNVLENLRCAVLQFVDKRSWLKKIINVIGTIFAVAFVIIMVLFFLVVIYAVFIESFIPKDAELAQLIPNQLK